MGFRGDAVVKDGKIKLFFGNNQSVQSYAVYSSTNSDVIVYSGSGLSSLDLDKNVKAYFNLQEQTLGNVMPSLDMGYEIDVFYNSSGAVDYVLVSSGKISGPATVYTLSTVDAPGFDSSSTYMRDGKKATKS
ncbi:MAG: hypothetical protein IKB55_00405, partial [Clostridia bacterium]|nr:hypothetical protein [Clostridia bacterium]